MTREISLSDITIAVRFRPAGDRGVERAASALGVFYGDVDVYRSFLDSLQLGQWHYIDDVPIERATELRERLQARGIEASIVVRYESEDPADAGYTEVAL